MEGASDDLLTTDLGDNPFGGSAAGERTHLSEGGRDDDDKGSCVFEDSDDEDDEDDEPHDVGLRTPSAVQHLQEDEGAGGDVNQLSWTSITEGDAAPSDLDSQQGRNVERKLSHPSSPRSQNKDCPTDTGAVLPALAQPQVTSEIVPGPAKLKVVVRDAAYATYRAVLYYVSHVPV